MMNRTKASKTVRKVKQLQRSRRRTGIGRWAFTFCILFLLLSYVVFDGQGNKRNEENVITGRVVRVSDGDSFTLLNENNEQIRVRLHGIDAPETRQPFSEKSREALANMIAGQMVFLDVQNTDRFGRTIAKVSTNSIADVGLELLKTGLAWHYAHFDNTRAYMQAEENARRMRLGLWADDNPINPYDFRRAQRRN
jgi:endonuclease YncB( thermonuclease family)